MNDNRLYMACIDLAGKECLVVGAGPVGVEKAEGLLTAGASVTVVAPEGSPAMERLAAEGAVSWERRGYRPEDLGDVFLVIAATSDTRTNVGVHSDAEERRMLVNVADVPHLCNFILPAVFRDGPVAVAVSTNGASPALAQRMKREAGEMFSGAYSALAALLEEVRPWAKASLPTYADRKRFFDNIVNGSPDPIALLNEGRSREVQLLIAAQMKHHGGRNTQPDQLPAASRSASGFEVTMVARTSSGA